MVRTDRNGVWSFGMMAQGNYSVTTTYTGSATAAVTAVARQTTLAVTEIL
jgi:hypothetical protein